MNNNKTLRYAVAIAVLLSLFVVMLGAFTRLTHAGLGCPDWPGCYGRALVPSMSTAHDHTPNIPLESRKAWTEMAHRYAASFLVLLVVGINLTVLRRRYLGDTLPWGIPCFLLGLIFFQAALGMWTVTLKLLPLVVMGHLLGGITIFASLSYFYAQLSGVSHTASTCWRPWIGLGIVMVFIQIALGGWVSANYAGIACIGFPQCNGTWLPTFDFVRGFNLLMPIGANYQGGVLDSSARIAIQTVHRIGAVVVATYLLGLMGVLLCRARNRPLRVFSCLALLLVLVQFTLGAINVIYLLPLYAAVAHNGVAAILLATCAVLFFISRRGDA